MKNKILSLFGFAILALLVLTSFASAAITLGTAPTLSQSGTSFDITVTSGLVANDVFLSAETITSNLKTITFISTAPVNFTAGETKTINMIYTVQPDFDFAFEEEYSTTLTAKETLVSTNNDTSTLTFEKLYYEGENDGELKISDFDFDVTKGFGYEDNDEWNMYPLDEVEVIFNVDNDGDYDIEDIKIEACLFDKTTNSCIINENDMDISDDKFDLDNGEDSDITITFKINPNDLESGNTNYAFYIKAVGDINDDKYTGTNIETGEEYSDGLTIKNDKFVIINNIKFNPATASCEEKVEVTAEAWNLDNEKLEDDKVYVLAYNKELGLNKIIEFDDGIKALKSEEFSFSFELSGDIQSGNYIIQFTAYDNEDMEDDDIFLAGEDEDYESSFEATLIVGGSCSTNPTATVSASLQSDAKAGKDLIVKATIVNTDSIAKTFKLSASGYADWASSATLDKTSVTINAGESQEVLVTLKVNKDVSGEQSFDVEVLEGNKFLAQPIKVTIEKSSFSFPNITGLFTDAGNGNWYLWGIGALNAVLILVIIIVAVRVLRKR